MKFREGSRSQNSESYDAGQISGIRMPSSDMSWGNLKLMTNGVIRALGAHQAGSEYDGYVVYSWTEVVREN